jgi:hypothetical protein
MTPLTPLTPCVPHRVALASYALGVLDDADSAELEIHLADCDECAVELADLLPTAGALATVQRDAFVRAELAAQLELPAQLDLPARRSPERQRRTRRVAGWRLPVSVAATAAALVLVAAVLALLPRPFEPDRPGLAGGAGPAASNGPEPGQVSSVAASGRQFRATDPSTGVRLELTITSKRWGSHLAMSLANVHGPQRCRMVVTDAQGRTEVISSWQVPSDGYGVPTHPAPLELQTDSYLPVTEISQVEVQTVDRSGTGSRLVALSPQ